MNIHSINRESRAYQRRVGVLKVDLSRVLNGDETLNDPNFADLAETVADDLRGLGLAPDDFSVDEWMIRFGGPSALVEMAREVDHIEPQDLAWEVSWHMGNVIISDATGTSITLTGAHGLRVAAAIAQHAGDRADEPQPDAA